MNALALHLGKYIQVLQWHVRIWKALAKFRLNLLVVFSSGITYLLALSESLQLVNFMFFLLGAFFVTAAANTLNQLFEIDKDKLMKRTQGRPLPTGEISLEYARSFAMFMTIFGGVLLLVFANSLTFFLSMASLILYAFVYTPMKQVSPLSVAVGAIPGALPPLIGWVAVTGEFTTEALIVFGIQFVWQFPHFWSIAWILDDDYKKAGFRLLPTKDGRSLKTAFQIMIYTLLLIPVGMLPYLFGMTGRISSYIILVCGILFFVQTLYLMKECSNKEAKKLMFASILYLPIVQLALLLDKM